MLTESSVTEHIRLGHHDLNLLRLIPLSSLQKSERNPVWRENTEKCNGSPRKSGNRICDFHSIGRDPMLGSLSYGLWWTRRVRPRRDIRREFIPKGRRRLSH